VFNIKGNECRVVVAMKYEFFSVYIRSSARTPSTTR